MEIILQTGVRPKGYIKAGVPYANVYLEIGDALHQIGSADGETLPSAISQAQAQANSKLCGLIDSLNRQATDATIQAYEDDAQRDREVTSSE